MANYGDIRSGLNSIMDGQFELGLLMIDHVKPRLENITFSVGKLALGELSHARPEAHSIRFHKSGIGGQFGHIRSIVKQGLKIADHTQISLSQLMAGSSALNGMEAYVGAQKDDLEVVYKIAGEGSDLRKQLPNTLPMPDDVLSSIASKSQGCDLYADKVYTNVRQLLSEVNLYLGFNGLPSIDEPHR